MARRTPEHSLGYSPSVAAGFRPRPGPKRSGSLFPGWLVTGLVVAGLGALAWYCLGPDLRRHRKIRGV